MKKLALVFVFAFATTLFNSCTPEALTEDESTEIQSIDKPKICPPNDRNCNGIPDSQE